MKHSLIILVLTKKKKKKKAQLGQGQPEPSGAASQGARYSSADFSVEADPSSSLSPNYNEI